MADPANFGHDRLGHLLSDTLLAVPEFQRQYSWTEENVRAYWEDINGAKGRGDSYFMGTVVLANSDGTDRKLIVDGQQRIITTALLLAAIRDRLSQLGHQRAAQAVETQHLSDYVLAHEQTVAKLTVSPDDVNSYAAVLGEGLETGDKSNIAESYRQLAANVACLAPDESSYQELIKLVTYLDEEVQVLLAVASGIPEANVIFETLNDRGADLTTADLLKNYLFSSAGSTGIDHARTVWTRTSGRFEKADDFVKFLRFEHMSRAGRTTNRQLYRAIQTDVGSTASGVSTYLKGLEIAMGRFTALREPDDPSWSPQAVEVKDSLLAFRRFGFESSTPLLLAAFAKWTHTHATRFVDVVASWSVRAWFGGTLGGGVAEAAFCEAAVAVSSGKASCSDDLLPFMNDLVPDDATFRDAVKSYGSMTTTRAKYLLGRLDRQYLLEAGELTDALPDWSSKSITVEHILAKSSKRAAFSSEEEYDRFLVVRDQLVNFALLERTLNADLEDKQFPDKALTYGRSVFALTRELSKADSGWTSDRARDRIEQLSQLATRAWPRKYSDI